MATPLKTNYKQKLEAAKMPNGKRKVLLAGIDAFSKKGYDGTSTVEIAELAGVSQATIFKYFKTKHDLLIAILEPMIGEIFPAYRDDFFGNLSKTTSLQELIHFALFDRFEFLQQNADIVKILLTQIMTNEELLIQAKNVIFGSEAVLLQKLFQQLKDNGELYEDIEFLDLIRTFAGQLLTLFIQTNIFKADQPDMAQLLTKIEKIIFRSLSPKA